MRDLKKFFFNGALCSVKILSIEQVLLRFLSVTYFRPKRNIHRNIRSLQNGDEKKGVGVGGGGGGWGERVIINYVNDYHIIKRN